MLMSNKKNLFFKFDILSNPPYLRIFGNNNYKTTWSTYISLIVVTFSLAFILDSSFRYFRFTNPNIYYWKDSAYEKNLSIKLNETILMFKIDDFYKENKEIFKQLKLNAYLYDFDYNTSYEYKEYELTLEECELGININIKFEELIKEFKNNHLGKSIHTFYCINRKDAEEYSLSYNKKEGHNYLYIFLSSKNKSYIPPKDLRLTIIMGNDFINHTNKYNPIKNNYIEAYSSYFDNNIFEITNFNLDYIEYDSDDGILFDSINTYHGVRLHGQNQELYIRKEADLNSIGGVKIQINRNTFDKFERNYIKLQYLLSEIESIIALTYNIGKILANIIARKKMSLDLSRIIMSKKTEIDKGEFDLYKKNPSFNEIYGDIEYIRNQKYQFKRNNSLDKYQSSIKTSLSSRNQEISNNFFRKNSYKDSNTKLNIKKVIKDSILRNIDINIMNELKMKKISVNSILRSYFCCFKDKKTKLINLCHSIILNELCIDRILIRLFKLEKIYDLLSDADKAKIHFMQIRELEEINSYLKKKFSMNTEEKENSKSLDIFPTNDKK